VKFEPVVELGHGRLRLSIGQQLVKGHLEDARQVDLDAVVQGVLAPRQPQPMAAAVNPLPAQLARKAAALEALSGAVHAQELGEGGLVLELDLNPAAQQPGVHRRPHRHAHIGRDAQAVPGL
jgi:hypothetical protein